MVLGYKELNHSVFPHLSEYYNSALVRQVVFSPPPTQSRVVYLSFLVVGVGPVGDAVARQDAPPPVPGTETADVFKHRLQGRAKSRVHSSATKTNKQNALDWGEHGTEGLTRKPFSSTLEPTSHCSFRWTWPSRGHRNGTCEHEQEHAQRHKRLENNPVSR